MAKRRRSVVIHTHLDVKLEVFVHLIDVGEDVADDARNDALEVLAVHKALRTRAVVHDKLYTPIHILSRVGPIA